jgi:hypothetical protein
LPEERQIFMVAEAGGERGYSTHGNQETERDRKETKTICLSRGYLQKLLPPIRSHLPIMMSHYEYIKGSG